MEIKLAPIVAEARGAFGDAVFSTTGRIPYIRRRVDPAQPQSPRQQEVRATFSSLSRAWRNLTPAQRGKYSALALQVNRISELGFDYKTNGQRLYVALGANLSLIGELIPPDALDTPNYPSIGSALALIAENPPGAPSLDVLAIALTDVTSAVSVAVYATRGFSAGRTYVSPSDLRYIGFVAVSDDSAADIKSLYLAKYSVFPGAGQKVAVAVKAISDSGFASPTLSTSRIVTV